ncbi:MAG: squalene/phytoene synthase family protein [Rhodospirillales bacterium]|nr:squalene/phytoene synthase family protein [Rhodospirillales bacterium]MBI2584722.1 squalene/phytoene synthase family protein [Rhodospirillales bacterium]
MTGQTPDDYCADRVRRFDRDRFLTALFCPSDRRADLLALYAFNIEIAGVRETVSEPLLGHIRIQWWRDALDGIYAGDPPAHHVAGPLSRAVRRHRLQRGRFETLLAARAGDLDNVQPPTMQALESYAEATSATITHLALQVVGAAAGAAEEAGRHVGVAWTLTGLLRALPLHVAERRICLPVAACRDAGIDVDALFNGAPQPGMARAVAEIAAAARRHLTAARALGRNCPRAAVPALLPAVLAGTYLDHLQRADFDPFRAAGRPHAASAGPGAMIRLAIAAYSGRF